ncbi:MULTISPECIES: response regulator transcription factor [unclassified Gordonia (in: high G+C Gram-positive bacteria)]|uniref:response regulator transcription factor n=1 Tax=unclassified Gordonia (in: high G+C Gram-positive bacteria) TaxID=2657482 RepID=UPI001F0D0960|nr:response regulator transcription factor [Gordonia sp. ABSL49_1]MCH5644756.1 response regulator transcription factor [Gordonia sp. ABSL49_1]
MRVLVIEDDPRAAETLRRTLTAEGWTVDSAADGAEGLESASIRRYDAIVCDIMMPVLNGYETVRELRRREVWTPVLMLTAKDGEYDQADAFDLGADDYLVKPFSFVVLSARLRALVRRGAPQRPTILRAGTLSLDPAKREVRRSDELIRLTAREFAVLECLMRHRGAVVSKAEILEQVWDAHYRGDDNIVEVYVGYLRKRIDAPFGCQTIETIRGAGYRLIDDTTHADS